METNLTISETTYRLIINAKHSFILSESEVERYIAFLKNGEQAMIRINDHLILSKLTPVAIVSLEKEDADTLYILKRENKKAKDKFAKMYPKLN